MRKIFVSGWISPGRWARFLQLHQALITHPHRNRMFAFALVGALALPLGGFLGSLIIGQAGGWHATWPQVVTVFVFPPAIAMFVVWATYPFGNRIVAFFLGVLLEFFGILALAALAVRVAGFT